MQTICVTKLRELNLRQAPQRGRPEYLSAASGLVRIGQRLYVVADDEAHLGIFSLSRRAGRLLRLIPDELPLKPKRRKKAKPDFEALVRLPAFPGREHGALLAFGSGSTGRRHRGVLIALKRDGSARDKVRIINCEALFAAIGAEVNDVNIEGAAITNDRLCVIQRGNKGAGINAILTFELRQVLQALIRGDALPALTPASMRRYDLGEIRGIPLTFTDAATLADGSLVFSAIAEDTADVYADGACAGSAIGRIDAHGRLRNLVRVRERVKIEGIDAQLDGSTARLLLVTDADDIDVLASLLSAELSL